MKFLIIDGETNRQRNLRSILGSLGYKSAEVESFDDPANALTQLKKTRVDCVFVAMELPRMSGLDFVKTLRGNRRTETTGIILYSSEVTKEDIMSAVQAGANSFLGHPFSVSDVESVIKQATKPSKQSKN